jgi:RND family efflux transporter MFP subunit
MKAAIAYLGALTLLILSAVILLRHAEHDAQRVAPTTPPSAASSSSPPAASSSGWVGVLLGRRTVDIAPRTSSIVRSVQVRAGDSVTQGSVLASLEARERAFAVQAAAAAQRSQLSKAQRTARLEKQSLASAEEAELARFEAERKSAELNLARVLAEDGIIRAPFAGTVVARTAEPGAFVGAGTPMFRLVDTAAARIRFGVSAAVSSQLALGQSVSFRVEDVGPLREARISTISAEVDRSAELVVIEADVDGLGLARSGIRVRVFVQQPPIPAP